MFLLSSAVVNRVNIVFYSVTINFIVQFQDYPYPAGCGNSRGGHLRVGGLKSNKIFQRGNQPNRMQNESRHTDLMVQLL